MQKGYHGVITSIMNFSTGSGGFRVPDLAGSDSIETDRERISLFAVSYKTLAHLATAVSACAAGRSARSKGCCDS